jgi:hypothetical protein
MKKYLLILVCSVFFIVGQVANAIPTTYTGSISWSEDIYATPNWNNSDTQLSWIVTDTGLTADDGSIIWNYEYTWSTSAKAMSHMIIELSNEDVKITDFMVNGVSGVGEYVIGTYSGANPSNPGMPGSMPGIKLDDLLDSLTATFSFNTVNSPVWGDFYAKDGKVGGTDTIAYNLGFLDADPTAAPVNGSIDHHILRPDTITTRVPDCGMTATLMGIGILGLGFMTRRKN